jgi:hypothetical protein
LVICSTLGKPSRHSGTPSRNTVRISSIIGDERLRRCFGIAAFKRSAPDQVSARRCRERPLSVTRMRAGRSCRLPASAAELATSLPQGGSGFYLAHLRIHRFKPVEDSTSRLGGWPDRASSRSSIRGRPAAAARPPPGSPRRTRREIAFEKSRPETWVVVRTAGPLVYRNKDV